MKAPSGERSQHLKIESHLKEISISISWSFLNFKPLADTINIEFCCRYIDANPWYIVPPGVRSSGYVWLPEPYVVVNTLASTDWKDINIPTTKQEGWSSRREQRSQLCWSNQGFEAPQMTCGAQGTSRHEWTWEHATQKKLITSAQRCYIYAWVVLPADLRFDSIFGRWRVSSVLLPISTKGIWG
jgi:hypothetical protein